MNRPDLPDITHDSYGSGNKDDADMVYRPGAHPVAKSSVAIHGDLYEHL